MKCFQNLGVKPKRAGMGFLHLRCFDLRRVPASASTRFQPDARPMEGRTEHFSTASGSGLHHRNMTCGAAAYQVLSTQRNRASQPHPFRVGLLFLRLEFVADWRHAAWIPTNWSLPTPHLPGPRSLDLSQTGHRGAKAPAVPQDLHRAVPPNSDVRGATQRL